MYIFWYCISMYWEFLCFFGVNIMIEFLKEDDRSFRPLQVYNCTFTIFGLQFIEIYATIGKLKYQFVSTMNFAICSFFLIKPNPLRLTCNVSDLNQYISPWFNHILILSLLQSMLSFNPIMYNQFTLLNYLTFHIKYPPSSQISRTRP